MIERLLAAEKALDQGMVDTAGRLFDQVVQADPRNAIALVGLAKVALREDRIDDARELAEQALSIDPDEAAAQRLLRELYAEVRQAAEPRPAPASAPAPAHTPSPQQEPAPQREPAPQPEPTSIAPGEPAPRRPRSLLARLRRWLIGPRDAA
jgi:tetratricopeptide (TPR) repeat protein